MEVYFLTMVFSIAAYIGVSLLTLREDFNLDRMLHHGQYRREADRAPGQPLPAKPTRGLRGLLTTLLGIDDQFTRGDKFLSWSVLIYTLGWGFGSWLVVLIWSVVSPWPLNWWANWFLLTNIIVASAIGCVSTVWFFIGGIWDLNRMFKRLAVEDRNLLDDGRVIGHVNADDLGYIEESSQDQVGPDKKQLENLAADHSEKKDA